MRRIALILTILMLVSCKENKIDVSIEYYKSGKIEFVSYSGKKDRIDSIFFYEDSDANELDYKMYPNYKG